MSDERFYDEVARELQDRTLIAGLWTRAFAETNGDNDKARALYIRYRVAQLAQLELDKAQNMERERLEQKAAEEQERETRKKRDREHAQESEREMGRATERAMAAWIESSPEAEIDQRETARLGRFLLLIAVGVVVLLGLIVIFAR